MGTPHESPADLTDLEPHKWTPVRIAQMRDQLLRLNLPWARIIGMPDAQEYPPEPSAVTSMAAGVRANVEAISALNNGAGSRAADSLRTSDELLKRAAENRGTRLRRECMEELRRVMAVCAYDLTLSGKGYIPGTDRFAGSQR